MEWTGTAGRGVMRVNLRNVFSCRNAVLGVLVSCGSFTLLSAQANSKNSTGEAVFKSHCVVCHGADGYAKTTLGQQMKASDLHLKDVQKLTDSELTKTISDGKNNMPPFGGQLTGAEIDQVVHYLRTFAKTKK